jgi:hypothetical protein
MIGIAPPVNNKGLVPIGTQALIARRVKDGKVELSII